MSRTHYRVVRERWSPIWPQGYKHQAHKDFTDKAEALAYYHDECNAVLHSSEPDRVQFGWCAYNGNRFRFSRTFDPKD